MGYGQYNLVTLGFYFDPEISLPRYSRNRVGAYISITHPDDSVSSSNTFFLGPNDLVVSSAKMSHNVQEDSFAESKCVHRYGLETKNFTSVPFQTLYATDTCIELCYTEAFFKECQCTVLIGWNMTETDCLEDVGKRECLSNTIQTDIDCRDWKIQTILIEISFTIDNSFLHLFNCKIVFLFAGNLIAQHTKFVIEVSNKHECKHD